MLPSVLDPADPSLDAVLDAHAALAAPSLVPELRVLTARELTPVWEATEAEARSAQPPPFWAFPWVGGQALARYVLDHPEVVAGRRVLDFATGGGLVALAAKRAGAAQVLAVDIDPVAIAVARRNAAHNALAIELVTADIVGTEPACDVVLTGDICYDRSSAERIAAWLYALAAAREAVLLGDGGRAFLPRAGLTLLARYRVATTREIESSDEREGCVWRVEPGFTAGAAPT